MSDAYVLQERAEAKRFLMLMGFSVFTCLVYGLRYEVAGAFRFKFLLWNLMLAWVPVWHELCDVDVISSSQRAVSLASCDWVVAILSQRALHLDGSDAHRTTRECVVV